MITKAIVLLSSGLDSSVALALSERSGIEVVRALTFDYGQRAARQEIRQAKAVARHYGIFHETLELPWFKTFRQGGGLLSSHSKLPSPTLAQLSDTVFGEASAKAVWVPNRNGVFLEIAAGFAEAEGAEGVIVGFNREEATTFPDNSVAYMEALTRALAYSTANRVQVISPTAGFDKVQIVEHAKRLDFPFSLLWSCYEARELMCGRCESCMRLKRALRANDCLSEVDFEDAALH